MNHEGHVCINTNRGVFYSCHQRTQRDVTVAVLQSYFSLHFNGCKRRLLDLFCGSGIRSFRFCTEINGESEAIGVDSSMQCIQSCIDNAASNNLSNRTQFIQQDIHTTDMLQFGLFHVIEVDPFGSSLPYVSQCVRVLVDGGILNLNFTDSRQLLGDDGCYSTPFDTYGITRPASCLAPHEFGLRAALSAVRQVISSEGKLATPLCCWSFPHGCRLMIRVTFPSPSDLYVCGAYVNPECTQAVLPVTEKGVLSCSDSQLIRLGDMWSNAVIDVNLVQRALLLDGKRREDNVGRLLSRLVNEHNCVCSADIWRVINVRRLSISADVLCGVLNPHLGSDQFSSHLVAVEMHADYQCIKTVLTVPEVEAAARSAGKKRGISVATHMVSIKRQKKLSPLSCRPSTASAGCRSQNCQCIRSSSGESDFPSTYRKDSDVICSCNAVASTALHCLENICKYGGQGVSSTDPSSTVNSICDLLRMLSGDDSSYQNAAKHSFELFLEVLMVNPFLNSSQETIDTKCSNVGIRIFGSLDAAIVYVQNKQSRVKKRHNNKANANLGSTTESGVGNRRARREAARKRGEISSGPKENKEEKNALPHCVQYVVLLDNRAESYQLTSPYRIYLGCVPFLSSLHFLAISTHRDTCSETPPDMACTSFSYSGERAVVEVGPRGSIEVFSEGTTKSDMKERGVFSVYHVKFALSKKGYNSDRDTMSKHIACGNGQGCRVVLQDCVFVDSAAWDDQSPEGHSSYPIRSAIAVLNGCGARVSSCLFESCFLRVAVYVSGKAECNMYDSVVRGCVDSGVHCSSGGLVLLEHCMVSECGKSGVFASQSAQLWMFCCRVSGNRGCGVELLSCLDAGLNEPVSSGDVGGVLSTPPSLCIKNSIIVENLSGGILVCGCSFLIQQCTVNGNRLANISAQGGARLTLIKCLVCDGQRSGLYIRGSYTTALISEDTVLTRNLTEDIECALGATLTDLRVEI